MKKILFVDRDGTVLIEPEDKQIDSLKKVAFVDGAILALNRLQNAGWRLVLVSNQDGLGTESFPLSDFQAPQDLMLQVLKSCGVRFDEILICPHFESDKCACRKPKTGLLTPVVLNGFDRNMSAVVGDRDTDLLLAEGLGVKGFKISPELGWDEVVEELLERPRVGQSERKSRETRLSVAVNLDRFQIPKIQTGSGFFGHMLEQIAYHARVGLQVEAYGDWEVDDHHMIEDTALALGEAIRKALGDSHGIQRFAFVLPMDESLAECALDLSGRPYSKFECPFTRETVGGLATEMASHFFRSLADGLRATLHIKVSGENNHHLFEAGFKAFGRCLGEAVRRQGGEVPSSKGLL